MAPRRGRLVRPLLETGREDTREYCRGRGLSWRDDPTNEDPRFARSRLRQEVLAVLGALSPAGERTIAETSFLLRDERQVLERAADEALARLGIPTPLDELGREPAALARTVLIRLAERTAGEPVALSRADCAAILALGAEGGSQALDLGGGLRAIAEYGPLRFQIGEVQPEPAPADAELPV